LSGGFAPKVNPKHPETIEFQKKGFFEHTTTQLGRPSDQFGSFWVLTEVTWQIYRIVTD